MKPRASFLTLVLAVAALGLADAQSPQSAGPSRVIKRLTVTRVGALTGPDAPSSTRGVDVCGTDIGTMAELGGKVYFAFGDSFGFRGEACPRFGPNWRSNLLGVTADLDPSDGIEWERWLTGPDGRAVAVTEGAHQRAFAGASSEQTRIPTAMLALGERLYLHYMSVRGFAAQGGVWECNFSRFVYSDDRGHSWRAAPDILGGRDSNFNMLALSAERGSGNQDGEYVYALGTPCGRFGSVRAARVRPAEILRPRAWQYLTALSSDGSPTWGARRADAIEVIPGPAGEGSLLWNPYLERWMYTTLNERTAALELREAAAPWGPWSEPHTLAGASEYPQLYGAYMTPAYLTRGGRTLYFVMSLFDPYNTFLMRAELER